MQNKKTFLTRALVFVAALYASCGYGYLSRQEAIVESTSIICKLFINSQLDGQSQEALRGFITDFTTSTFTYGVSYSQFNETNVASMVIESAAQWIAQQSINVALREVMTDRTFAPHFSGANYFNQTTLKKAIHRAILAQATRVSKKPLERVHCGDFHSFIGNGLRAKVREQISLMISRDCGAYCDAKGPKMLLHCGHMLHRECAQQLQKPVKCPQCRDLLDYLELQPAPVYQPKPTQPVYQTPSAPRPKPVYQPQQTSSENNVVVEFLISIGLWSK